MAKAKDVLLISPDAVKAATNINYNVSDSEVSSAIRSAQDTYLVELIGEGLLNRLKELVFNAIKDNEDNIDDAENEAYSTLLEDYVQPYLCAKSQVEICVPVSFKIRNIGVTADYDTNIAQAQLSNVNHIRDYYETQSVDKGNKLSRFLASNKASYAELEGVIECGCSEPKLGYLKANTGLFID